MNIIQLNLVLSGEKRLPDTFFQRGRIPVFEALGLPPQCEAEKLAPWQTWEEWRKAWKEVWDGSGGIESYLNLLYYGFKLPEQNLGRADRLDRMRLYMSVANGWMSEDNFYEPGDPVTKYRFGRPIGNQGHNEKRLSQLRHLIAVSAHSQLCLNAFARECMAESGDGLCRVESLCESGALHALMTFYCPFECESRGHVKIANLPYRTNGPGERDHNEKAHELITGLVGPLFCYSFEGRDLSVNFANVANVIRVARLWVIEVLTYLDKLYLLNRIDASLFMSDERSKFFEIMERAYLPDRTGDALVRHMFAIGNTAAVLYKRIVESGK